MNGIQLQPHTSTEKILVYSLEWQRAKQVIRVQSPIKNLENVPLSLVSMSGLNSDIFIDIFITI